MDNQNKNLKAERAFGELGDLIIEDLFKERLPVRVVKGAISVGASAFICVGFGLMVLALPKQKPPGRRR